MMIYNSMELRAMTVACLSIINCVLSALLFAGNKDMIWVDFYTAQFLCFAIALVFSVCFLWIYHLRTLGQLDMDHCLFNLAIPALVLIQIIALIAPLSQVHYVLQQRVLSFSLLCFSGLTSGICLSLLCIVPDSSTRTGQGEKLEVIR